MAIAFLSKEILIVGVSLFLSGAVAWNDVTNDIQANTTKIEGEEKLNEERHEDLTEGQRRIQDKLDKLLEKQSGGSI
jgi:hypothetical protein